MHGMEDVAVQPVLNPNHQPCPKQSQTWLDTTLASNKVTSPGLTREIQKGRDREG